MGERLVNARPEHCPACVTKDGAVTVQPSSTRLAGEQVLADYECPCGHSWQTSWLESALADPGAADPAA